MLDRAIKKKEEGKRKKGKGRGRKGKGMDTPKAYIVSAPEPQARTPVDLVQESSGAAALKLKKDKTEIEKNN